MVQAAESLRTEVATAQSRLGIAQAELARIETELGWEPKVDFETGLEQTVRWYLDNQAWWAAILERSGSLQFDWSTT